MIKTFDISIKKARKIMAKYLFKTKIIIALLIIMFGCLAFSIYCILIGSFVDTEAFQYSYYSLVYFAIVLIILSVLFYISLFKRIKGKSDEMISYEYQFNDDGTVLYKNLKKNKSSVLNKNYIKKIYIIDDVLVVTESFIYLFPNDEDIKKELNYSSK